MRSDVPAPSSYDLANLTWKDFQQIQSELRGLQEQPSSLEQAANAVVRFFYDRLVNPVNGERSCALVRCFKTFRYADLPDDLQEVARRSAFNQRISAETQMLTLLGTAGDHPDWNDRRRSNHHRAIPLASEEMVRQSPMIAQMIQQFGLDIGEIVRPDKTFPVYAEKRDFGVFHVQDAVGSPFVPAQNGFVLQYGIRSILGFGSLLASGDLFLMLLFAKVEISAERAQMLRKLSLAVKLHLLGPYNRHRFFESA